MKIVIQISFDLIIIIRSERIRGCCLRFFAGNQKCCSSSANTDRDSVFTEFSEQRAQNRVHTPKTTTYR